MENRRKPKGAGDKIKVDLTVPVDANKYVTAENDCFTKEWDMRTNECKTCSDNEICGILFSSTVKKLAAEREKSDGQYLDTSHLNTLNEASYSVWCSTKTRTTDELYDKIAEESNSPDEEAIVQFMKRFFVKEGFHSVKGKIYAND